MYFSPSYVFGTILIFSEGSWENGILVKLPLQMVQCYVR